jgi:group II intron reverse transcriptase/maturase
MENQALTRLEALRKRNADRDWVNSDLYRLLYKPDLYEVAYEKIKSSPGNMTAGTDGTTLDGFSYQVITDLIGNLRDETFQFKPAKRVFIPKANGKMRPLGIASPRDKVVQEGIRMILETIYDSPYGAYFRDSSHGFRPNRSCHTALREFSRQWAGVTWIIEGDVQACFDEIDHHTLIALLKRKIADERFINLIWKALRAGYLWKKERNDTLIGSSQGSILSPMLANVYLHELDCFLERLKAKYDRGTERAKNPEYYRILKRRGKLLVQTNGIWTPEIKTLTKQLRTLPSRKQDDPDFVRIKYIRYADDWIVGITGPKTLAETIKEEIRWFLKEDLKLQLSAEKTHITHAKSEEAFFLGTRLMVGSLRGEAKISISTSRHGRRFRRRATGWLPILKAPIRKLMERLHRKGFCDSEGFPSSKKAWVGLDADQIIRLYNSILHGLLNYYRFADNFAALSRIQYILRFSLAKTLAHKYRRTMKAMLKKHGRNLHFQWKLSDGRDREVSFAENTDWQVKTDAFAVHPADPDLLAWQVTLRTKSKLGFPCLICGSERHVNMHHVRHIRKMEVRKPPGFLAIMRALNRKQVPVCRECHLKIHSGEYDGLSLKDLAYDFTAKPM